MTKVTEKKILEKLNSLEEDLHFIKWYVVFSDKGDVKRKSKVDFEPTEKVFQEAKKTVFDFDIEEYVDKKQVELWK